jgi:lipid II:glycine glycyltransferase (peptidoglycan interpeptide bridge formation enzyme)
MEIREIKDKMVWEDFLQECEEKTFLQSWNWGEFNKMMGEKIWRLGIYEKEQLIGTAFFYKIQAKRGTFIFVPHGPNMKKQATNNKRQLLEILLGELKKIAKEEKCDFIRIAPILEKNEENIKIFKALEFKTAPTHIHPELTWELDITPSEEEILAQMRKTTRYLIKQAEKNTGVKIIQNQNINNLEKFDELNQRTVNRHHFVPFSLDYLKKEFLAFSPDNQPIRQAQGYPECIEGQISIFLGEYKKELVSSGIFVFWQGIAFYHHGASSLKYPKIPVSYLLIWEAIKEARKRGCKKFNFWGIAPVFVETKTGISNFPGHEVDSSKNCFPISKHPWAGLTLFKMGFGGYKKEYVKTQDFSLSRKYWLIYFFEKMRKIKRGL